MSLGRKKSLAFVALGLRAQRGGASLVAIALIKGEPCVLLSSFLATARDADRLAFEPYHVAVEMKRAPGGGATAEIEAAVAKGRGRQEKLAAKGLADIAAHLRDQGYEPAVAALLINRAGWVTDLLTYSLAFADHPPVAEGLAVREALRSGVAANGLKLMEIDEKSLFDLASETLRLSPAAIDAQLKALGGGLKPWRKEQKAGCLAAWFALAMTS